MDKDNKNYCILSDGLSEEHIEQCIDNHKRHQDLVGDVPKEILKKLGNLSHDREITKIKVDMMKTARCYDKGNLLHNSEGPAVTRENGEYEYFIHGKLHNEEGPAMFQNGEYFHYLNGAYIPVVNYEREVQRIQQHKIEIKETQALYEKKDKARRDRERRQERFRLEANRQLEKKRKEQAKKEREERKKQREIEMYQDTQEEMAQQRRDKLNNDARKERQARKNTPKETIEDINASVRESNDQVDEAFKELAKAIENWKPELTQPNEEPELTQKVNAIKTREAQITEAQEHVNELMNTIEPELAEFVAEIFYHQVSTKTSTYNIETARVSTTSYKLSGTVSIGFMFKDRADLNRIDIIVPYDYITNPAVREKRYDNTNKNLERIKAEKINKHKNEIDSLQHQLKKAQDNLKKAEQ